MFFYQNPEIPKILFIIVTFSFILGLTLRIFLWLAWKPKGKSQSPFFQSQRYYFIKISKKLSLLLLVMGVVGLMVLLFNYENIAILGSRVWFIFWLLGFLFWLGYLIFYGWKKLPKEKQQLEQKRQYERYLPH